MSEYHLAVAGQQWGPYTFDELRSQGMAPDALVWREGMTDWLPASQMPELSPLLDVRAIAAAYAPASPAPPAYAQAQYVPAAYAQPAYAQPAYPAPQYAPNPYPPPQVVNTVHVHAAPVYAPVFVPTKSVGVAFLLTFLFGPLGMFYSTVGGALVMLLVSIVAGVVTMGLSILITWPVCIVWGCVAASNHNSRVMRHVRVY